MSEREAEYAASGHRCPTCEQKLDEVVVRITGVCPTHGVVPVVCGDPECWCASGKATAPRHDCDLNVRELYSETVCPICGYQQKETDMTVYEVIDGYFRRFGLFATRDKAEEWAQANPLHYFVGIEKRLVTPAENGYRVKEVVVA